MFNKGDMVVYGRTGVCAVEDICEKEFSRGNKRRYYRLRPVYQHNNVIYAPVDSDCVFMRNILSRPQAEKLVEHMPEIRAKALAASENGAAKAEDCCSCDYLAETAIRIHNRKAELRKNKKKLGFSEEKQLKNTEELLFGELAVVFKVLPEQVPGILFGNLK